MPDILDELRADLDAAFVRAERSRGQRRRWTVGAATAALATAAAVVALSTGSAAPATAAEALRAVARVAQDTPAPVPRDDQFYYVHSRETSISMFAGADPEHEHAVTLIEGDRKSWVSVDRPGQRVTTVLDKRPLTPADAGRRQGPELPGADGRPSPAQARHHYLVGGERLSRADLLAYPTDPRTVYERIRDHVGPGGHSVAGQVFDAIGAALKEQPAPPGMRAALYQALALVPRIELAGAVTDRVGRAGVAVAFTEVGTRHELIFDPETSELLGSRDVLVDPTRSDIPAPVGTVIGDVAYLERAVVDELP